MYFEGAFSHAVRKGALLPQGAGATAALFAAETITAGTPGADELRLGEQIMAAVPFKAPAVRAHRSDPGPPSQPQCWSWS